MQGVEGQIFGPMARTYGYALAGALIATFTVTPMLASFLVPEHVREVETLVVRAYTINLHARVAVVTAASQIHGRDGADFCCCAALLGLQLGSEFLPTLEEGNLWIRASMPSTLSLEAGKPPVNRIREIHTSSSRSYHRRLATWPAG